MKFSCAQPTLVKALNIVSKAVTSRTTIPILKGILLSVDNDGYITMSASDLDIRIENKFKVDNFEPGETVVQAKLFGDIIRKLPGGIIKIEENENNVLITCGGSEFNIIGSPADEYPVINNSSEDLSDIITIDKDIIKKMIVKTSFAASIEEARGVITGVLTELNEDSIRMVALDGFRMAVSKEEMKNSWNQKVIIPAKNLNEIAKIISECDNDVNEIKFYISNKKAYFIIDNVKVVLSILEGNFVDYNKIIPKETGIRVIVNKNDLHESIERASLLAKIGKNNLIKLSITDNNIEITSKSEEGNVKENVIVSKTGNDLIIGFNAKYLIDALKSVEDEEISMYFNTPTSPCLIKPIQGESYEYLILPVRITNN